MMIGKKTAPILSSSRDLFFRDDRYSSGLDGKRPFISTRWNSGESLNLSDRIADIPRKQHNIYRHDS